MALGLLIAKFILDFGAMRLIGSTDSLEASISDQVTAIDFLRKGFQLLLGQPVALSAFMVAAPMIFWQGKWRTVPAFIDATLVMGGGVGMAVSIGGAGSIGQQVMPLIASLGVIDFEMSKRFTEKSRGEWVAVIDCDLQDNPSIIPALYAQAKATHADAVMVNRGDWSDGRFRRWASWNFYKVMTLFSGIHLEPNIGNFGLYSRRLVNVLLSFQDGEVLLPAMVAMTGLPRSYLTLDRSERHAGHSTYNLKRLPRLSIAMIIRFSDRPLKISVLLGLFFSFFSVLISVILVIVWAFGIFTVPGWTSLILSLWFLAGLILSVLGVHGFYIGRIFAEVKRRPRIMVARTTDDPVSD